MGHHRIKRRKEAEDDAVHDEITRITFNAGILDGELDWGIIVLFPQNVDNDDDIIIIVFSNGSDRVNQRLSTIMDFYQK